MTHPPASFKTMIKDGTIKRADAMKVRYSDIRVKEGFNLRDLDDEYETGIEALASYILAGGTFPALEVIALPDGSGIDVVDGHRRYDAIGRAIQRGAPSEWVQAKPEGNHGALAQSPRLALRSRQKWRPACFAGVSR